MRKKHQDEINNLQFEFQTLLQKKLREAREESEKEIKRIKLLEREVREQSENQNLRLDKDYILKSNHEGILASEILNLRTKHINELKDIDERYEREYSNKLKEAIRIHKQEYENTIASLKSKKLIIRS